MFSTEIVDKGGGGGDAMRALTQWRHPVDPSEAQDVLYRAMRPTSHRCIHMAIEIASDLPAFVVVVDSLSPTTKDKKQSNN